MTKISPAGATGQERVVSLNFAIGSTMPGAARDAAIRIWDNDLAQFADATLEQSGSYGELRWHGRTERHNVQFGGGKADAMAQVIVYRIPLLRSGLGYVKFGPVWRRKREPLRPERYRAIVSELVENYCIRGKMLLTILPRPNPEYQATEATILTDLGFVMRRHLADDVRYLVNLAVDETTQRDSLSQGWRRNLKRAEKHDLAIAEETSPNGISAFQSLHREMVARKNASKSDPIDALPRLCSDLPAQLALRVVIVRYRDQPVAGAVVTSHGDTAYYLYGSSNCAGLELCAGYAMHWWLIRWLRLSGVSWYDLGGGAGSQGLAQFKEGLVGKAGCRLPMAGEFDRWTNPAARVFGDTVLALRKASSLKALVDRVRGS